ncbi:MAG: hypothetical protein AAF772_00260 [Acidobacteriota bacterium]
MKRKLEITEYSFWQGLASISNVLGLMNHGPYDAAPHGATRSSELTDLQALGGDWETVGQDLQQVLERFERAFASSLEARSIDADTLAQDGLLDDLPKRMQILYREAAEEALKTIEREAQEARG